MPELPYDLERLIFEQAAFEAQHNDIVQMMLVAKRVYEWLRQELYRVVILQLEKEHQGALHIRNLKNVKIEDVGRFVKHAVTLLDCEDDILRVLTACPNIEDLAIWWGQIKSPKILSKWDDLPLRVLSADFSWLGSKDIKCPAFTNLTHLEILRPPGTSWESCRALTTLPKLTHLCFDTPDDLELGVIQNLLGQCPLLQLLIVILNDDDPPISYDAFKSDDPRFLVMDIVQYRELELALSDWKESALGRMGFWEFPEKVVEARNRKLFVNNTPLYFSRGLDWIENLNENGILWYKTWKDD